jgi:GNAT superfamily N-acetyltransferase
MQIRPMQSDDVEPLIDVVADALWGPIVDGLRPRQLARMRHLLATDPGGAWVAEHEGAPVGTAMSLIREGLWGFSLYALADEHRGGGTGGALFDAALAYGADCERAIILSSEHPAAMRVYARAGFALRPAVSLSGLVRNVPAAPPAVREGDEADLAWIDDVARAIRGAGYDRDLAVMLAHGARLSCVPYRGFLIARGSEVAAAMALDDEAAGWLLQAHLAGVPAGETAMLLFLTAGQDWAIRIGLEAGLVLSPDGPVFTRGDLGPLRPWIPTGAYL